MRLIIIENMPKNGQIRRNFMLKTHFFLISSAKLQNIYIFAEEIILNYYKKC